MQSEVVISPAAKFSEYKLGTTSGGTILPGHDYVPINMEQAFQNQSSAFGKMILPRFHRHLHLGDNT